MSHWSACSEESSIPRAQMARTRLFWTHLRVGDTAQVAMNSCSDGSHSPLVATCKKLVPGSVEVARHQSRRKEHRPDVELRHGMLRAKVRHAQARH